ncbi:hypothetical protein ERJ70_02290 [Sediminibacillus dalangtanensis]|uniref:DUF1433 domain-containing protein n=1 Tax=Sediminibacillus dalangtanensis TaxID=2729421 RepID=A0ABX7VUH9_9BACI|nr:hypothetical protein [Sediminibacillus dalangtanensis]QTM98246.1 hypothetical protein ERJ70_02290 [Sediminibacillus dalangtanensis]
MIINGKGWLPSLGKFLFIIILPFVSLVGCMADIDQNNFDEETINQAKETAESFLRNNYESIQTIEFSEDYSSPMGVMLRGTVNGESEFSISMNNSLQIESIGAGEGFPNIKEECKEQGCDY